MSHSDALPIAHILKEHIHQNQTAHLTVSSDSMSPLLKRGDVVGVRQADPPQLQPGEIITCSDPGKSSDLITHRLAGSWHDEQGDLFIVTRGDQVLMFDPPAPASAVLGRVVWRSRNGRLLRLDAGRGMWLSGQLGRVSERTRQRVTRVPLQERALGPAFISLANRQALARRKALGTRLTRTVARTWSALLATIVITLYRLEHTRADAG